jgi:hypothetical protein
MGDENTGDQLEKYTWNVGNKNEQTHARTMVEQMYRQRANILCEVQSIYQSNLDFTTQELETLTTSQPRDNSDRSKQLNNSNDLRNVLHGAHILASAKNKRKGRAPSSTKDQKEGNTAHKA